MGGPSEEPEESAVDQMEEYFVAYALTVCGAQNRQRVDFLLARIVPRDFDGKIKVRVIKFCPRDDGGFQVWVVMFVNLNNLLPAVRRNMDAFYELNGGKLERALLGAGFDVRSRSVDVLEFTVPYGMMKG